MRKLLTSAGLLAAIILSVSIIAAQVNVLPALASTWTQQFTDSFTRSNGAIGNNWSDPNSKAAIVSNQLQVAYNGTPQPWSSTIFRPSSENATNQRIVIDSPTGNTESIFSVLRAQDNQNMYWAGIFSNTLFMGKVVGNTQINFGSTGFSFNSAHAYRVDFTATGTLPTTVTGTITDLTSSSTVATATYTDSESVLQAAGMSGFYAYSGTSNPWILSSVTTYTLSAAAPATSYTFTGPTTASLSTASSNYTITPNGTYSGTITPSDSGAGGTFTPASLTFASSSVAQTFTYTPSATGTKTISVSSSPALSNPSSISVSVTDPNAGRVSVTNPNLIWSPYTWRFNGSSWAQTSPGGAYVKIGFTGSTLGLNIDSSMLGGIASSSMVLHAYVDGSTTPISKTFSDISNGQALFTSSLGAGTHYAIIYLSSTPFSVDRWNGPADALRITSLQVAGDGTVTSLSSTPLAKKSQKVIFFGDSITEGYMTTGDEHSYAADIGQQLGVEYGQVAYSGAGWNQQAPDNVPLFYDTTATSSSFWRKFDSATTRLNDNANLSSGFIDGVPNAVYVNMGINDANAASSASAIRTKMTNWLSDIRTTVGSSTAVFVVVPFNFNSGSNATYKTAYLGGVSDYQTAHPSDARVFTVDLGTNGYTIVTANSTDNLHPNDTGSALLAAQILASTSPYIVSPITSVSNVSASPSLTGATITWNSDQAGTSQVEYGTSSSYTASTTLDSSLVTSHSASLTGLSQNTTYHFRVVSTDSIHNKVTSSDQTFTTSSAVVAAQSSGSTFHGGSAAVRVSAPPTTSYISPVVTPQGGHVYTRSITVGSTGADVKSLQQYLNAHGFVLAKVGAGSLGHETTMFGAATRAALAKFQKAHGISPAAGYFGIITLTYINAHP